MDEVISITSEINIEIYQCKRTQLLLHVNNSNLKLNKILCPHDIDWYIMKYCGLSIGVCAYIYENEHKIQRLYGYEFDYKYRSTNHELYFLYAMAQYVHGECFKILTNNVNDMYIYERLGLIPYSFFISNADESFEDIAKLWNHQPHNLYWEISNQNWYLYVHQLAETIRDNMPSKM